MGLKLHKIQQLAYRGLDEMTTVGQLVQQITPVYCLLWDK